MRGGIIIASVLMAGMSVSTMAQSQWKSTLPVKPGRGVTVAGTVECDGRPVAGVKVSDGYEVVKTDKRGAYYLKSKKQNPQVFISAPSGYEPVRTGPVPEFWADFTAPAGEYERHDFRLKRVDNTRHAVLFITDVHLANERRDVETFATEYVEALRKEAKRLEDSGVAVYTINLGDASWDRYWYGHQYNIRDFRKTLEDANYPTAIYHVMGNHDNDGGVPNSPDVDLKASLPYQQTFGPRYYSQDIGGVHYVMLDNIDYQNEKAKASDYPGLEGRRNYIERFTPEQLAWLRKDLADVPYDRPVVLNYHGPIFKATNKDGEYHLRQESTKELLDIMKPYKNVHAFSGHSHKQKLVRLPKEMQAWTDHNISGTSGSWWRTAAAGYQNLCPDANPVAYELMTVDGSDIKWEHHGFELPAETQFYAWDINGVKKYCSENGEMRAFLTMFPEWKNFADEKENAVYITLFADDAEGELTVTEQGERLEPQRIMAQNPLHMTSYMIPYTIWLNRNEAVDHKPIRFPFYRVMAKKADTPIEISWRDASGHEYRQTLKRPATFNPNDYRRK